MLLAQVLRGVVERFLDQLLVGAPLLRHLLQHLAQHLGAQRGDGIARGAQFFAHGGTQPLRLRRLCRDQPVALLVQAVMQIGEHGAVLLLQHLRGARGLPELQRQQHAQQHQHANHQ